MDRTDDARWIVSQLEDAFGPVSPPGQTPVETLVLTILSQNTTDTNRDRAYASLLDRFGSLLNVAQQEPADIADAIQVGGLQTQKAASIHGALRCILDAEGELTLDPLRERSVEEAMGWLLAMPGVGRKTAGIVCLFALGLPYFPIDTHIRRVMTRLGWIHGSGDPHPQINAVLDSDPDLMSRLHLQLIWLGRTVCRPRTPKCADCPLRKRCPTGLEVSP